MLKRLLAAFLVVCLTFGTVAPTMVFASETNPDNTFVGEPDTKNQPDDDQLDDDQLDDDQLDDDQLDDGQLDDGQLDDGQLDDGQLDDGQLDDGQLDDGQLDDGQPDNDQFIEEEQPQGEGGIDALAEGGEELEVKDYATFLANLKVLEGYAAEYAASSGKNAGELVLNFIRTGVERYNDGNWKTLAGEEITGFTTYVQERDAAKNTTAMCLRNIIIDDFKLPNGNQVDFGHMFGTMNIAYIAAQASADLGGWAGDICDLLFYSKYDVTVPAGTVEEMAAYILNNCFGINADNAFGMDDFYGDMDAIYLIDQMKDSKTLSAVMEAYFTADLSDRDRSEYFMKNRFKDLYTKESVRDAVYNTYISNVGIQLLEAGRDLAGEADLRQACCYAFADYVYNQAGDTLEKPVEPEEPENPGDPEEPGENPYYTVFSSTTSNLAPGIRQTIKYANTADNKQIAYYLAEVDVTRDDVTIMAGYKDADPSKGWGMQRVVDQANALGAKHSDPKVPENYIENFRPIVATNGSGFNMSTGKPSGLLVMNGVLYNPPEGKGFFAILKDGSAVIGTKDDYDTYKDQIQEAIADFGATLVKDGKIVNTSNNARASRTAIGIKADGSVVMMVLDGRQEPFSCGGSYAEIAQIMFDTGCVDAINLDGGGSTTFAAKPEGSDTIKVINRPSDGYQRSVSTSLIAVSTAKTSKEFAYANVTSEYDYLTVGTSLQMTAVGVSESGSSAPIPEGAAWKVSDESLGSVTADGVFTAADLGDVEVQLVVGEEIIGKKTLHVVVPDALSMEKETMNVIYGQTNKLPLLASYQGNPVAFTANDMFVVLEYSNAGSVDGLNFVIDEASEYRTLLAGAALMSDFSIMAMVTVNCYRADEAVFDFDNVTSGDEQFAWNREITNSQAMEHNVFQIKDTKKPMELSYVFAMDMQAIDIPAKLADLTYMLPGADQGKTAWDFMLQLAERVSTLTTVQVTAKFDPDLNLDCSEMTISNDFFEQESIQVDHNTNTVTINARWVDQTAAVDPATVNPVCILSGVKATPKTGANWDDKNQLLIFNEGSVSYRIYLRASALYSFANIPTNQQTYDLHPFSRKLEDGTTESGAYFGTTYASFEDQFTLDKTSRQGWYTYDNQLFYFVDNEPVTGIQRLPGYEDPARELVYSFDENGVCTSKVTGLFSMKDKLYYAINGEIVTGWRTLSDSEGTVSYYYFDPNNGGAAVDGTKKIAGYTYTFEDCKLIRGQLVTDSIGTRYRWAGQWAKEEWLVIDGREAYAQRGGYFIEGLWKRYYKDNNLYYFAFGEDGFWMKEYSGIYDYEGKSYLIENGLVNEYPGLVKIGEDYYYFCSNGTMVKNCSYWFSKPNGIIPEGRYTIDADGKVQMPVTPETPDTPVTPQPPVTPDPDVPVKNGIVKETEDIWYYYVNGVKTYAGLILIDGDYYYVDSSCMVKHDCTYWISKNNGYMKNGSYTFDSEGKMVLDTEPETPPVTPEPPVNPDPETPVLNGIVKDGDTWYYYVNGVKTYAGLIKIDGDYYYVNAKCQVVHGCTYYISKNNGITKNGSYTFDADGKMILDGTPLDPDPVEPELPEEKPTGIVKDGNNWFYYVDGVKTYAGLIKLGNDYYYVDSKCMVKHDCTYWITKHNGITREGSYTFDAEGKMVLDGTPLDPDPVAPEKPEEKLNGIVKDGDNWFYYVDGVKTYAGVVIIDGYYYYVDSKCMVKHDCTYWISKTNGYVKEKSYTFDEEGRMVGVYPEAN